MRNVLALQHTDFRVSSYDLVEFTKMIASLNKLIIHT